VCQTASPVNSQAAKPPLPGYLQSPSRRYAPTMSPTSQAHNWQIGQGTGTKAKALRRGPLIHKILQSNRYHKNRAPPQNQHSI